jgi:hypothetical protein
MIKITLKRRQAFFKLAYFRDHLKDKEIIIGIGMK